MADSVETQIMTGWCTFEARWGVRPCLGGEQDCHLAGQASRKVPWRLVLHLNNVTYLCRQLQHLHHSQLVTSTAGITLDLMQETG